MANEYSKFINEQKGEYNLSTPTYKEYESEKVNKKEAQASAFDELRSKEFATVARRYYSTAYSASTIMGKDPMEMTHDELIRTFYEDRVYANNNTLAISADLGNVVGASEEEKQDYAYLSSLYHNLPSFWNEERSFGGWLKDYGGALLLDPVNLIGFGVGGQAAKQAYKKSVAESLKGLVKEEITKEVLEGAAKDAAQRGLKSAVIQGGIKTGGVNAAIAGGHDAIIQGTEITADMKDEFSLARSALSTGFGFGLGSVFGGVFSGVGFTRQMSKLKRGSFEVLENQHLYGKDLDGSTIIKSKLKPEELTSQQLKRAIVSAIDEDVTVQGIRNGKVDIEKIKTILDDTYDYRGKPPDKKINTEKINKETTARNVAADAEDNIDDSIKVTNEELIDMANVIGETAEGLKNSWQAIREFGGDEGKTFLAQMLAGYRDTINTYEKMYAVARQMVDMVDDVEKAKLAKLANEYHAKAVNQLQLIKDAGTRAGQLLQSQAIAGDDVRFNILADMQSPDFSFNLKKIEGNSVEFWESFGKLQDPAQRAAALEDVLKYNKWDVANQFINNNLLSSPDTTFLNVVSGLANAQWKPFVQLLRSGRLYLNKETRVLGRERAEEAMKLWIYQFYYTKDALRMATRSFYRHNPILDPRQTKFDSQLRQNAISKWAEAIGNKYLGKTINQYTLKPAAAIVSAPMRVIGASDEFLKQMAFRAKAATQVDTLMRRKYPQLVGKQQEYQAQWKIEFNKYFDEYGRASQASKLSGKGDAQKLSNPLQYARELSYTQSLEGQGAGAAILAFAERNKWARALGLHFISTPTNLLRWNFQHFPLLGRYQFQMRQMLKKGKDGKYIDPEAAAEAQARMHAGSLLWGTAVLVASSGVITGGGSKDPVKRREQEKMGWQAYSLKIGDRYVSFNRLDPMFLPFGIAADLKEYIEEMYETGNDLPKRETDRITEAAMATLMSVTRNMTSKFYTKNILELATTFLDGGMAYSNNPERTTANIAGQFTNKVVPLSGLIRYTKRVTDDEQRELRTYTDKLIDVSPFNWRRNGLMPKRNALGEVVRQKRGWFLGLGGDKGLWSSPFAMSVFPDDVAAELVELDIDYTPPPRNDRKTGIDLDDIRNYNNQTAYDRWIELSGTEKINGKTMKETIVSMLRNPRDPLYNILNKLPKENIYDERKLMKETYIKDTIRRFQAYTFKKYFLYPEQFGVQAEFPEISDKLDVINLRLIEEWQQIF